MRCIGAKKAKVTYRFNEQSLGEIITNNCPIDIEVKLIQTPVINNTTWYKIRVLMDSYKESTQQYDSAETTLTLDVLNDPNNQFRSKFYVGTSGNASFVLGVRLPVQFLGLVQGGDTGFPQVCRKWRYRYELSAIDRDGIKRILFWSRDGTFLGNNPAGCPQTYIIRSWELVPIDSDSYENSYQLTVTDSQGIKYKVTGKEKPTYNVACDGDCPEGTIRCKSKGYPGYCCIPCKEVANRINNLAARI
ncbi:hypothetical protein IQ230_14000 [Gloeocapsopsis crepidinum LEGE 06123]|uniref:Uncharacterized protein n=1 Tax=Gloeocapsopsis crepidinum LEGE 06123 TaxID=588587 RepID=A0ABR9UV42_9CHRO|nr:hypothetical protein [Gloeocapsopsis crepidinum]MBE9191440.1 hypothetical protein [Gloeocapsopsis crepidinum LEGE 06123]